MTTNYEDIKKAMDKIREYNKEKRLIGIKVKPFVLDALRRNQEQIFRKEFTIIDKLMGLDVYIDNEAEYPFTPIYNNNQNKEKI